MAADFAVNWVNELFCHTQSTQELFLCIWTFGKKWGGGGLRSGKILLQLAIFFNGNFSSVVYATESHDTAQLSTQLNKF